MKPLLNLDDLINWEACDFEEICLINYNGQEFQEESGAHVKEQSMPKRNKVLLCHDMKGGYLDDKTIEKNENVYAYRFYNWNLIDVFVYFSHYFITIPPSGWTVLSHMNGVQCLGTVITEGDHSREFHRLFEDVENVEIVAQKLTEIKTFYNFDGWLINIECSCQAEIALLIISNIKLLLRRLMELGNEVYWYDAITESGHLSWQNGLTKENQAFFTLCGNMFLNYCWSAQSLIRSAEVACGHCYQVFVGIDCFGRGCFGGGGFRCDVACTEIERVCNENPSKCQSKFSVALFAPAWCWETLLPCDGDLKLNEHVWLFFTKLVPHLNPWSDGRQVYRQLPSISIEEKEFSTNFDIGQGLSQFLNGIPVSERNYNRLLDQNLMPTGLVSTDYSDLMIKLLPSRRISYTGHSCMTISAEYLGPCLRTDSLSVVVELFRVGCYVNSRRPGTLKFVVGRDRDICSHANIWDGLRLVLSFNESHHCDVRVVEFPLEFMDRALSDCVLPVEWWIFERTDLLAALETSSSSVTIRKIDVKIVASDVIDYLTNGCIYFGHLSIS